MRMGADDIHELREYIAYVEKQIRWKRRSINAWIIVLAVNLGFGIGRLAYGDPQWPGWFSIGAACLGISLLAWNAYDFGKYRERKVQLDNALKFALSPPGAADSP